ncbi:hypothetical protein R84981_002825 [Carnimonas sp. R-84981]|uniref:hypothetical protein n=1 Tax=Carnimonas bestiolae TaxID=3402172 RepID=UPI003EDBA3DE
MAKPLLDVTEVLDCDEFKDDMVCTRRTQITDDDGFTTDEHERINFSGVVTVDKALENTRLEAGQQSQGAILVCTKFCLTSGDNVGDADIVTYRGRDYRVSFVDDYERYGAGFVQAHCELLPFNGGPHHGE